MVAVSGCTVYVQLLADGRLNYHGIMSIAHFPKAGRMVEVAVSDQIGVAR
jgi:hypothetical protein